MKRYGNRAGNSGVVAYEITATSIFVRFRDSERIYEYRSTGRAGPVKVARMKALAQAGKGLTTYITQYAHDDYERD